MEHLPRITKELELSIGDKFIGAMAHFHKQVLINLAPSEEQDDFTCQREDGTLIRVQVVEVVDQLMRRLEEARKSYSEKLVSDFPDFAQLFSGCRLTITDAGCEPTLPSIRSKEGILCLNELAFHIKNLGEGLGNLSMGKRRVRKYSIGPSGATIFLVCERFAPNEGDLSLQLHWSGGRAITGDERLPIIADVVAKKIRLHYSKPREEFWLLVYSRDVFATAEAPELLKAMNLLKQTKHPFDQVWYFFPYSNKKLGHLVQIWP